tara:strand:+ start:752 stop:1369 length:618 start_codon:yes stop_codon:yes gene_type:complete
MKKLILFDFDGVLFNSKRNMEISWQAVMKKYSLKKNFFQYSSHLGLPFRKILKNLGIYKNHKKIEDFYQKNSIKHFDKIKPYPGVIKSLNNPRNKFFFYGIWTSKHHLRVNKLLKKYNLNFKVILTPEKGVKGKPHPDQVKKCLKSFKMSNKDVFYVGDMDIDRIAASNAKINFIYASYGFGKLKKINKKVTKIKKFENIFKTIN